MCGSRGHKILTAGNHGSRFQGQKARRSRLQPQTRSRERTGGQPRLPTLTSSHLLPQSRVYVFKVPDFPKITPLAQDEVFKYMASGDILYSDHHMDNTKGRKIIVQSQMTYKIPRIFCGCCFSPGSVSTLVHFCLDRKAAPRIPGKCLPPSPAARVVLLSLISWPL